MKPLFCNTGRHRVIPPKFLANTKIGGRVVINCGVPGCKGKATVGKKQKEVQSEIKEENHGQVQSIEDLG